MFGRIALSLVIGFSSLTWLAGQALPDRPEKLTYPPLVFQVPKAKDYSAKLKNNIPVYISDDDAIAPIVNLAIHWRGGKYMEPEGKEGLANIFGAQISQGGSLKMDIAKQEDRLEDLAANISSRCGDASGSISMRCMEKDFKEVFEMMIDSLAQPAFAQDRLDIAKRSAREEMEQLNDSVVSIAQYLIPQLMMGENHFMAKRPTTASIDSITREDLQAFHERVMHPSNFVVSISGNFNKKMVMDRLNATIGAMRPRKGSEPSPKPPAPDFARKPGIYIADKTNAPQSMIMWALPGMRRSDDDWYAATLMNFILGGGSFTSKLMKKIRSDEGLTYGIYSFLTEGAYWTGDVMGYSQTSNNTVAYLLRLAVAEMEALKNTPIPDAELQTVKDGMIESFPSRWGKMAAVNTFASEAIAGWPEDWWVNYREKIQAVTPADVQRMARRLLDMEKIILVVVGEADKIEAGDHDRPGLLKDVLPLPMQRLPLRDPNTGKPM
ncbi:MAG: insulinase family protein [Holophagales bacterium]|jgi:predicted Zn-dependent peptidase|nr:insulinase family protein [Holophagales bacterium]